MHMAASRRIIESRGRSAIIFDDPRNGTPRRFVGAISERAGAPTGTLLARSLPRRAGLRARDANAIPISAGANADRIAARLASATRVRTLHSTVFRRGETVRASGDEILPLAGRRSAG